jgi:hypothetical protein
MQIDPRDIGDDISDFADGRIFEVSRRASELAAAAQAGALLG